VINKKHSPALVAAETGHSVRSIRKVIKERGGKLPLKYKKRAAVDGLTYPKKEIAGVKSKLRATEGKGEVLNAKQKCEDWLSRCKSGEDEARQGQVEDAQAELSRCRRGRGRGEDEAIAAWT
jgi:hypothetical protein